MLKRKETTGKREYERQTRPRAETVVALAMSRENQDRSSESDLAREAARLQKRGYVCLARLAESYAEAGPPGSYETRLKRAQSLLITDLQNLAFRFNGLLLDSRATGPRRLTPLLFTMLMRTAVDHRREGARLLEGCWVN